MVQELENFRKKYPEYSDIDDFVLSKKLAQKYPDSYSDLPNKVMGEQKPKDTTKVTSPENESQKSEQGFLGKTISNIPSSGYQYAKTMVSPETYKGLGKVAASTTPAGWAMLISQGEDPFRILKSFGKGVVDMAVDRYGGWENIKKTISEDPIGFLTDVSTVLTGGGAAASKIGTVSKAGQIASKTGKFIEPLSLVGKAGEKLMVPLKGAASGALGITTGAGKAPVEEAMVASKTYRRGLAGKISGEEIIDISKGGIHTIKEQRGAHYRAQLAQIESMPNPPRMNIVEPMRAFADTLTDYHITPTVNPLTGKIIGLDFGRSAIRNNPKAQGDFNKILDTLQNAFNDPNFYSNPTGFDIMKRQLQDMFKESSEGRAAVEKVGKSVRNQLVRKVSGYEEMVKDYEKTTKLTTEIESALSLKNKKSIDTGLRKLNTAMREDDNFRRSLIVEVEKASGQDISAMLAGTLMSTWMPKSWMGREIAAGSIFASLFGNPAVALTLVSASPRLVGEMLQLMAKTKKVAEPVTRQITPPVRQAIQQTGRATGMTQD